MTVYSFNTGKPYREAKWLPDPNVRCHKTCKLPCENCWAPEERKAPVKRYAYGSKLLAGLAARCVLDPGAHLEPEAVEAASWLSEADQLRLVVELWAAGVEVYPWLRAVHAAQVTPRRLMLRAVDAVLDAKRGGADHKVLAGAVKRALGAR